MKTSLLLISLFLFKLTLGIDFPKDFVFGTATAAYQIEGAWNQGGRAPSIWDTFSKTPGKVFRNQTGDIACDHYHRYKEDIRLMADMGVKHYRLSISWSRVLPSGRLPVNPQGIRFYNDLINELLKYGIEPHVTLYHWDLPQALHNEYKGWLSRRIIEDFKTYANVLFSFYGDRVKNWITINEPFIVTNLGYNAGIFAPGRCSDRNRCREGDSRTEPWIVTHHMLLAHAAVFHLYDQVYRPRQKGTIGITLNGDHAEPSNVNSELDKAACQRNMIYNFGWFADPLWKGDYPDLLKQYWGDVLPVFTEAEKKELKGSSDFFGLNHYTSVYVKHDPNSQFLQLSISAFNDTGNRIGRIYTPGWLSHVPWGARRLMQWLGERYNNPNIIITENGCGDRTVNENNFHPEHNNEFEVSLVKSQYEIELNDTHRVEYYRSYLQAISDAIYKDKVIISGYFAWSFMDNYEWADGYSIRFGLHYVDYRNNLKRYPKDSAKWWKQFLREREEKLKNRK